MMGSAEEEERSSGLIIVDEEVVEETEETKTTPSPPSLCFVCCFGHTRSEDGENGGDAGLMEVSRFLKFVVEVEEEDFQKKISKLDRSVCGPCLEKMKKAVKTKENAVMKELKIYELQKALLKELKEFHGDLEEFRGEVTSLEEQIATSDFPCLEDSVKKGDLPEEVIQWRKKIGEVSRKCKSHQLFLQPKFKCDDKAPKRARPQVPEPSEPSGSSSIFTPTRAVVKKTKPEKDPLSTPPTKSKTSNRKPTTTPIKKEVASPKAPPIKRNIRHQTKRTSMDASGDPSATPTPPGRKRRLPNPNIRVIPDRNDPRLQDICRVRLVRLTDKEISRHTKKPVPSKPTIKKKIVYFGSSDDTEDEEDDLDEEDDYDEDEDEDSPNERDSLISFVSNRAGLPKWRRKVIAGLLGKMKYEIRQSEKEGKEVPHKFEFNRTTRQLTFGGIEVQFFDMKKDKDRVLGCAKCRGKWTTSHKEPDFFVEIKTHMLNKHLNVGGDVTSSINSDIKKSSREVKKGENWDPKWDDPESSDDEFIRVKAEGPRKSRRVSKGQSKGRFQLYEEEKKETSYPSSIASIMNFDEEKGVSKSPIKKPSPLIIQRARPGPKSKKVPARTTPRVTEKETPSKRKQIMERISKWNAGKEGKSCLELIRKNVNPKAPVACTLKENTGEMSVLGIPILLKDLSSSLKLECSECVYSTEVTLKGEGCSAHRDIIFHILAEHSKTFDCPSCGIKGKTLSAYLSHQKIHQDGEEETEECEEGEVQWIADASSQKENEDVTSKMEETQTEGRKKISRFGGDVKEEKPCDDDKSKDEFQRTGKISLKGRNEKEAESGEESTSEEDDLFDI